MMRGLAAILGFGVAIGACALALVWVLPARSESADEFANGRYAMTPVVDGFLRLDTRTGQVSLCSVVAGSVQCRAGADERAALEAEIDRLSNENARLKSSAPSAGDVDEDRRFDRALERVERFVKRMLQLFRDQGAAPPSTL
jgi:hypothetical protein